MFVWGCVVQHIAPLPHLIRSLPEAFHDARVVRFDATQLLPKHMFNATLSQITELYLWPFEKTLNFFHLENFSDFEAKNSPDWEVRDVHLNQRIIFSFQLLLTVIFQGENAGVLSISGTCHRIYPARKN